MKSWDNLAQQQLPDKGAFKSTLRQSEISDADYQHVNDIWRVFNLKNLGELTELYLKTDVLLLNAT